MESHTCPFLEERHIGPAEEHHHIDLEERHTGLEAAVRRVIVVADRDTTNAAVGLGSLEAEHRRDLSPAVGIRSWILVYHRAVVDLVAVEGGKQQVSLLNYSKVEHVRWMQVAASEEGGDTPPSSGRPLTMH